MIQIKDCECGRRCRAGSDKCATCETQERKIARMKIPDDPKPVNKVSCSQRKMIEKYNKRRKAWLRGKKCAGNFHHNCTINTDLTCHHMAGRIGYHDEWARENDVPLLLDERLWLPLCLQAHRYVEENKKWACENGYSFLRVSDPVFQKK